MDSTVQIARNLARKSRFSLSGANFECSQKEKYSLFQDSDEHLVARFARSYFAQQLWSVIPDNCTVRQKACLCQVIRTKIGYELNIC